MKRNAAALACGLVLGAGVLWSGGARAETAIDVDAQVRARSELDKRQFAPGAAKKQYTDLRTRAGIKAVVDGNAELRIQLQDSRRLGGTDPFGSPLSGTLNDGRNVDVHQAYVAVDALWEGGPGIQAGRFEVNLGNQRVFGAVGWDNVGRSWEGAKAWYDGSGYGIGAYWLKGLERNDPGDNQDIDLFGITADLPGTGLEFFGFLEHDAFQVIEDANRLDRFDLGGYYQRTFGRTDVQANAVYQFGNRGLGNPPATEQDIAAFLVTAELGYTFPGEGHARAAVGVDYASGDDDPADDAYNTYNNLYYTGHKFRGYMDYFLASQTPGLMDLAARGKVNPAPGWTVKGDLHYFMTAQDYVDVNDEATKNVGIEIDLGAATTRVPGVTIDAGVSVFLPDASFAGSDDKDPGVWAYAMLTAGFTERVK